MIFEKEIKELEKEIEFCQKIDNGAKRYFEKPYDLIHCPNAEENFSNKIKLDLLKAKKDQTIKLSKAIEEIIKKDIDLFIEISKCLNCQGCKKIIYKRVEELKKELSEVKI